jgi:hypothetical protein
MNHEADLQRVVEFFETMTVETAAQLGRVYAADVTFKDPFNEVKGITETTRLFTHMFEQVDGPRFVVKTKIAQGGDAFITWEFLFRMRHFSKGEQCIRGATHLRFNDEGLVSMHRDYWDAAEELYEKLPVLRSVMRLLKRIVNA